MSTWFGECCQQNFATLTVRSSIRHQPDTRRKHYPRTVAAVCILAWGRSAMSVNNPCPRRAFSRSAGLLLGNAYVSGGATSRVHAAPGVAALTGAAPQLEQEVQIDDVRADRAIIGSRSDRAARVRVEYDNSGNFARPIRVRCPASRVRPVLGICHRATQRRHFWSGCIGSYLWSAGSVLQSA